MTARLMEGVSGVRGIVGESLDEGVVRAYAIAFAGQCDEGPIVVARDPRATGRALASVLADALRSAGRSVVDLGIVPTPTLLLNTALCGAAGGVMVTASHNPEAWNGLKFAAPSGRYLAPEATRELIERARAVRAGGEAPTLSGRGGAPTSGGGETHEDSGGGARHAARVAAARGVDVESLRSAGLRVVVDGVNGAASELLPASLREWGVQVEEIHCDMADGTFPRPAEPLPDALVELGEEVRRTRADLGLGLDPDGDRLALVGPDGVPLGEDATLALAAMRVLEVAASPVVANLSTSRMIDDVAAVAGVEVVRTPVGEINVAEEMLRTGALVGGEGNGGVIHGDVVMGRDALVGAALVLSAMAAADCDLPTLRSRVPVYAMVKQRLLPPPGGQDALARLLREAAGALKGARLDTRDGLRADWEDRWVHVRPSNTEPVVRVICEAPAIDDALQLASDTAERLGLLSEESGGATA